MSYFTRFQRQLQSSAMPPPPNSPGLGFITPPLLSKMASSSSSSCSPLSSALDLRALEYLPPYDRHLMCLICHCPFIEPVRLNCDHFFCSSCIRSLIRNTDAEARPHPVVRNHTIESTASLPCPTCRTNNHFPLQKAPRLLVAMCDDITVKCPYWKDGCEEIIKRGLVKLHANKYCKRRRVRCPGDQQREQTCGRLIPAMELEQICQHGNDADTDEPDTDRECEQCSQTVSTRMMEVCS